jgi:hypothetical protein
MSRVHQIQRSPVKKMRFLPKDVPQGAQRGMMPWQITEYRQVYCLDRIPDGQLPDTVSTTAHNDAFRYLFTALSLQVIHIHVEWVWRTRKLGNIENPPQVLVRLPIKNFQFSALI